MTEKRDPRPERKKKAAADDASKKTPAKNKTAVGKKTTKRPRANADATRLPPDAAIRAEAETMTRTAERLRSRLSLLRSAAAETIADRNDDELSEKERKLAKVLSELEDDRIESDAASNEDGPIEIEDDLKTPLAEPAEFDDDELAEPARKEIRDDGSILAALLIAAGKAESVAAHRIVGVQPSDSILSAYDEALAALSQRLANR
jgi:L-lactate utilization protein LutC